MLPPLLPSSELRGTYTFSSTGLPLLFFLFLVTQRHGPPSVIDLPPLFVLLAPQTVDPQFPSLNEIFYISPPSPACATPIRQAIRMKSPSCFLEPLFSEFFFAD